MRDFLEQFTFYIGIFLILMGLLSLIGLAVPRLGRRLYRVRWPPNYDDPKQRRAAYVAALLSESWPILFGITLVLRHSQPIECEPPDYVLSLNIVLMMFAAIGVVSAIIIRNRTGLLPPVVKKPPTGQRRVIEAIVAASILLGPCVAVYSLNRYVLNRTYSSLYSIAFLSPADVWAVGTEGWFSSLSLRIRDERWTAEPIPSVGLLIDIDFTPSGDGWIITSGSKILHYQQDQWTEVPAPTSGLGAIDVVSDREAWAIGARGAIVHYLDGAWSNVASPTETLLEDIMMISSDEGWAVGSDVILHYSNGRWEIEQQLEDTSLLSVHMVSSSEGWAVGGRARAPVDSIILHYQNGLWQYMDSPVAFPLESVSMVSPDEGWAVGGGLYRLAQGCAYGARMRMETAILHYQNGRWERIKSPVEARLKQVKMIDSNEGWIVGDSILRYKDGSWQKMSFPN